MALFSDVVTITPKITEKELKNLCDNYEKGSLIGIKLCRSFNNIIKQALDADE